MAEHGRPTHGPVEAKVTAATAGSLAVAIAVAVLNGLADGPGLLGSLPMWAQTMILLLVPPLHTWLAGYSAPHTERPDLPTVPPASPFWRAPGGEPGADGTDEL